jgi:hypothetical protein
LIVGPIIAAAGFGLLALPGIGGSYWTTFFPAITVLGLGMAISVAPLTTTVMGSVEVDRAGIASGVNNAIARTAGLVAIAALGIIMLQVFNHALDNQFAHKNVPASVSESLRPERTRLAAAELPPDYDSPTRQLVHQIVASSFITGFRTVMLIGSALAVAGAVTAAALIASQPAATRMNWSNR